VAGQCTLACLVVSLPQVSRGEIAAGAEVPTSAIFSEQRKQQITRTIIEPYRAKLQERGIAATEDEGLKALQVWIDGMTAPGGVPLFEPLVTQVTKAKESGCAEVRRGNQGNDRCRRSNRGGRL
jgi:hypothetical protein